MTCSRLFCADRRATCHERRVTWAWQIDCLTAAGGAADEPLPARRGLRLTSQIDLVCYGPRALCTLTVELPSGTIYVMTLARTTAGINKAEDAGTVHRPIRFAIRYAGLFLCQETLCGRISASFDLRQCAGLT